MAYDGTSDFTGTNPQIDVIPDAGATLADSGGFDHEDLHNALRDGLAATQAWLKAHAATVLANSWVTTARIANMAVTDAKIASVSITKLTGTPLFSLLRSSSYVQADTYIRAGSGSGNPFLAIQRFGGTLDGSGNASVAHNIGQAHLRTIVAQAAYRGGSTEWVLIGGTAAVVVDGTYLTVTGGAGLAGLPWRGAIVYTEDVASW